MHRNWIVLLTMWFSTTGCISNSGSEKSITSTDPLKSSAAFAANGLNQDPTTATTPTSDWWSTSWKTNPLTSWMNKGSVSPASHQAGIEAKPTAGNLDPISLDFATAPENAKLYVSMAKISDKGGSTDQARMLYQKALSIEPNSLPALMSLARFEDRQGDLDKAIEIYQKAITSDPKNPTALNDLAICYARKNQLQTSLELLEQAVEMQPEKAIYRNNIAKVLTELNQQEASLAHLSAVHPPAVAQYNQGVLLAQRGRLAEASQCLTQALTLDPEMQAAQALLDQLKPTAPIQIANNDNVAKAENVPSNIAAESTISANTQPQISPNIPANYPSSGMAPRVSTTSSTPSYSLQDPATSSHSVPGVEAKLPLADSPYLLPPIVR